MRSVTAAWAIASALALFACGGSTTTGGGSGGAAGQGGSGNVTASGGSGNTSSGGSGNVAGGGTGGGTSFAQCTAPGSCTLLAANCCGYCGPADLSQFIAVELSHVQDMTAQLCADPVACPDCIGFEEPNYLALCRGGTCTGVDLRTDALSACATDGDCHLRWGAACCESCGGNALVAVTTTASLEAEVCPKGPAACPPCMPPPYPTNASAVCDAGHCSVKYSGLGGP